MKKSLFFMILALLMGAANMLLAGPVMADEIKVTLSGSQQNPPVTTSASGSGTVTVNADMTVSVNITTSGIAATAAHIHMAPAGRAIHATRHSPRSNFVTNCSCISTARVCHPTGRHTRARL